MSAIHVALLGYGTVGKGVYQTLEKHKKRLRAILGKEIKIAAVLVKNIEKHYLPDEDAILTDNFEEIIGLKKLDVVIDAIVGKEPGYSYLQRALKRGCHVITANKEMFAHYGNNLQKLANENNVSLGFEATVAGGIPVIQTLKKLLNANKVEKVQGILNGTSNFILTKMREEGYSFASALKIAQEKGYAEADPANDIEGHDAFFKAVILSEVIFGKQPEWDKTYRQGISSITLEQVNLFSELGFRFKHVASLQNTDQGIQCSVKPVLVAPSHALYQVEDVQNAINIEADIVGNISLQGPGAGMFPTASAIIEDLIHLDDQPKAAYFERELNTANNSHSPKWVITGSIDKAILPKNIKLIGKIHPNALLAEGDQETVASIQKTYGDFSFFEILGEFGQELLLENVPDTTEKIFS